MVKNGDLKIVHTFDARLLMAQQAMNQLLTPELFSLVCQKAEEDGESAYASLARNAFKIADAMLEEWKRYGETQVKFEEENG